MDVNIYATNSQRYDFSSAEKYLMGKGKIHFFTEGTVNIFRMDSLVRKIEAVMETMNPQDYLLIAGNGVISGLVMALVYDRFKSLKILIWDNRERGYIAQEIEFKR